MASIKQYAAIIFLFLVFPLDGRASTVYLEPDHGSYGFGKTFLVNVMIDTESTCINAAKVDISFDKTLLKIADFTKGKSIMPLWTVNPDGEAVRTANASGVFSFSGGIPGGYCGKIAADSAQTNILGGIIFEAVAPRASAGGETITGIKILDTSEIYLNDGSGSRDVLKTGFAAFTLSDVAAAADVWQNLIKKDTAPPERFEISVKSDPQIFGGKYFIIFNATDKETGIDHYDAIETPLRGKKSAVIARNVSSPYLLKDQALRSKIVIKAFDKAGNETSAQFEPGIKKPAFWEAAGYFGALSALMVAIGFLFFALRSRRKQ